jgi:hypothetical protein
MSEEIDTDKLIEWKKLGTEHQAKDANIRQAILDRFGGKEKAIGKKANPGPLYGVKSHLWSALAVALYISDVPTSDN